MHFREAIETMIGFRMASIAVHAATNDPISTLEKIETEKKDLAESIIKAISNKGD